MCQLVLTLKYDNYGTVKWKQVNNKFLIGTETTFLWVHWAAVLKLQRERSTASSDKWDYKEAAVHLYIRYLLSSIREILSNSDIVHKYESLII